MFSSACQSYFIHSNKSCLADFYLSTYIYSTIKSKRDSYINIQFPEAVIETAKLLLSLQRVLIEAATESNTQLVFQFLLGVNCV